MSGQIFRLERDIQTEDTSHGTLVFESGVVASVMSTVLAPREASTIRIDTQHATVELEHTYGHNHANWRITPARHISAEQAKTWQPSDIEVPSSHLALLADVYAALFSGGDVPPVAAQAARAFEIVAALYASARAGRPITRAELASSSALRGSMEAPVADLRR